MKESRKKKTYVIPKAVPVIFRVNDIVVTSTGGSVEGDGDLSVGFWNKAEGIADNLTGGGN